MRDSFIISVVNAHLGGVESNIDGSSVGLLSLDPLDVDAELLPVALDDLSDLLAFVVAADHLDLVVLADGHGADSVLGLQLLGQGGAHQLPADVGGRREVPLPLLGPVRGHVLVQLHGDESGGKAKEASGTQGRPQHMPVLVG